MANSRRDFLKKGIGLVSLSATAPLWWQTPVARAQGPGAGLRTLVVLQLGGGNDGLNCVVPYASSAYQSARPTLGFGGAEVLQLDAALGLHPGMTGLKGLYDQQKVAIINGCGYPQPNRSHFRSMDIWHTAEPVEIESTGWLGRFADLHLGASGELAAINIGGSLPKSLNGDAVVVPSIVSLGTYQFQTDSTYPGDSNNQVNTFLSCNDRPTAEGNEKVLGMTAGDAYEGSTELQASTGGYTPMATYPTSRLGTDMQFAAQIITAGVGTRIIYLSTGGYDTHANQPNAHANLLADFSNSVTAFQTDLEGHAKADDVAVLCFSEFGRRVEENGSSGTDHGTAGPMFVIGSGVTGGLHGEYPSLTSLDTNGDLIFNVDFREVYADALQNWLQVDSQEILEAAYTPIGVFGA